MEGPPPPPPPHGEKPRTTRSGGLPDGKYDIFVIPPSSAGSGFLYLPSLNTQRNSFIAGCACTSLAFFFYSVAFPVAKEWFHNTVNGGGSGVLMIILGVGVVSWALGKTQGEGIGPTPFSGSTGASGSSRAYTDPPPHSHHEFRQEQARPPPPPPREPTPPPREPTPPPAAEPKPQKAPEPTPNEPESDSIPKPQSPPPKQKPSWQRSTPNPDAKSAWEKAREETRRREEERKRAAEIQRRREELERERTRQREKETLERLEREWKEKKEKEEEAAKKAEAEIKAKQAKDEADKKQQREKERREREAREALLQAAKEAREAKEALERTRKEDQERRAKEERDDRERKAREEKEEQERKTRLEKEERERKAAEEAAKSARASNVSSSKKPPMPSARTERDDASYVFRPYDRKSQQKSSNGSVYSDDSYAPSVSTSKTTPPPSTRGPYSTKDPDKIIIRGVYSFNNAFMRTPIAQLVTGQGNVTDGLILRITSEGLFIDDDVRGVPQREWDVKAWTIKLAESIELQGHLVLRVSIRDQEGKKYVFVLTQTEGWKVAVGLQRLRKGSQVRALGIAGMPANEARVLLESLGWS